MKTAVSAENKTLSWTLFDQISERYDLNNRILSFGIDRFWRKKVHKFLPVKKNLSLIDLATGTADQILTLAKFHSFEKIIGIDLSENMLALGRKKLEQKQLDDCASLMKASATELPFEDAHFDVATISFGIRNLDDTLKGLKEMKRVLKNDGRALILEFSTPKNALIRAFYLLYLRHILPRIGGFIARNSFAYRYLNQTIETFPSGEAFCQLMREAGFKQAKAHPLTFGVVTIYIGDN